jgi:hypothetical protein
MCKRRDSRSSQSVSPHVKAMLIVMALCRETPMGHDVRLFVGHPQVLSRYQGVVRDLRFHTLTAGAVLAVLSLDDDLHDRLHRAYGTGEWLDAGPNLTTTDMAFAARASEAGALAYVQTAYFGGAGAQCAVLWGGGDVAMKPAWLDKVAVGNRSRSTWPINAALRALGVRAAAGHDEFESFGIGLYRTHDAILARALPVQL